MRDIHYLRFVRALALAGTASLAACGPSTQPDVISTGAPCSLEGQSCNANGLPSGDNCCRCFALDVDSGSPDVVADADTDAASDASTDPDAAPAVVPGVYHSICIGPLTPPENVA